jgi:hypothetical protein
MKSALMLVSLLAIGCGESPTAPIGPECSSPVTVVRYPNSIPDIYIVLLVDGVDVAKITGILPDRHGFQIRHVYDAVLGGFSAVVSPGQLQALRCDTFVKEIHEVQSVGGGGKSTRP